MSARPRPRAVLAMMDGLHDRLFSEVDAARLDELVDLDPIPWTAGTEPARLAEIDIVVSFWFAPPLTDEVLARMPRLELIAHAGGSVRSLVGGDAWRRGIRVTTSAEANAEPVARFTLGLILLAARQAVTLSRKYAAGEYRLGDNPELGAHERTIGVIGASRTGRALVRLLAPFGYTVLVADPYLDQAGARELGVEIVSLDELLRRSDIVTLHAPDLPSTMGMLGVAQFAAMRDGATFINTARPALIDQESLVSELASGRLFAMLDVSEPEPLLPGHVLFELPNVFVTPHLAGAQGSELRLLGHRALEEVERFVTGDAPLRPVTTADLAVSA